MNEDKLSKEWLKKNGHKLKTIYSYAVVNKLDIKSEEDVLGILKVVDTENATKKSAKVFSKMLHLFGMKFRKTLAEKIS
ncbi:MAG: hypothetical protein KA477_00915 [Candidatus Levybacteria bacterium]|nr:hypothetical protein [Candidatus Levybacteria bacterium]